MDLWVKISRPSGSIQSVFFTLFYVSLFRNFESFNAIFVDEDAETFQFKMTNVAFFHCCIVANWMMCYNEINRGNYDKITNRYKKTSKFK